jgi:hypothetical protein
MATTIDIGYWVTYEVGLRFYDPQWPVPFISRFVVSVVAGHVEIFSLQRP